MRTNHTSTWDMRGCVLVTVLMNDISPITVNQQFQYSAYRWVEFPNRVQQQRDDSIYGCSELFIEARACPPVCACGRVGSGKAVVHFLKGDLFLIRRLSLNKNYSDSVNSLNSVSWICSASAAGTFLQLLCVKLNNCILIHRAPTKGWLLFAKQSGDVCKISTSFDTNS